MKLVGGDINDVIRIGDTVRRPCGPWTPAVHDLLRHFEQAGFEGVPRVLGIDDEGREILSYVEGRAGLPPTPGGDEVLESLGRLLREMHDAQSGFVPPPDAAWQRHVGQRADGEIICHFDLSWTNVIFEAGSPIALIDWDFAAPGDPIDDVACAASYWAPLRSDEEASQMGLPTDRRGERMRSLCDAYGLAAADRAKLLDSLAAQQENWLETHRLWGGAERRQGWAKLWDAGSENAILANIAFVDDNRKELERWLS